MTRMTPTTGLIALALGALLGAPATAADSQPNSLLQIFNRIPKTPATTQEADKLLDGARQLPAIAALKADLDAHGATTEQIFAAADARVRARMGGAATPEQSAQNSMKVVAVAGIDMARMQSDKAYAAEVQARVRSMSPQEVMAMSAAMSRATGTRGSVAVYDPPAVKAAAEAGQALMQPEQQAARTAVYQRRWSDVERKVAAIGAKYAARQPKMQLVCDGEGGGRPECVAERSRYVATMMPLLYARDAEILQVEAAALEEERAALAPQVRAAEQHLLAAQYGAASNELGNPTNIFALDGYVARDIRSLATRFEEVVKRAALVTHCGSNLVLYPSGCHAMH